MTVEDLEVSRQVRAVFARNWINHQKVQYGATHGTVYINGRLSLLREPAPVRGEERDRQGVSVKVLVFLEKEILKVPGVRGVRWNIQGWQRTRMTWVRRGLR